MRDVICLAILRQKKGRYGGGSGAVERSDLIFEKVEEREATEEEREPPERVW